jgi:uncharacterized protein (TIGR03435 family)
MKQPPAFKTGDPSYFVMASTSGSASPTVLTVSKGSAGARVVCRRFIAAQYSPSRGAIQANSACLTRCYGGDILGSALHIFLRLLIGIPDDLGWRVEQAVIAGTSTQRSIALGSRVAGDVLFVGALWVIDADAHRRRPATGVAGPAAVVHQDIEGRMSRHAGIVATVGVLMLPRLAAQSPPNAANVPVFEVASIKPNPTGFAGPTQSQIQRGGRFVATNIPVRLLIGQAYQVQSYRLVGGPRWLATDGFDINAKADGELFPRGGQRPLEGALRALLADRFKLVVHVETRELPVYALVIARSDGRLGPNLTRSPTTDCDAMLTAAREQGGGPPPPPDGHPPACGVRMGNGTFSADSRSPSQLAGILSAVLDRRVVDQTGLTGLFNADLTWTPDQMPQRPPGAPDDLPPVDPNAPSIFTAVQEQLGLKLKSTTGPVEVLVIDSVERPTPY